MCRAVLRMLTGDSSSHISITQGCIILVNISPQSIPAALEIVILQLLCHGLVFKCCEDCLTCHVPPSVALYNYSMTLTVTWICLAVSGTSRKYFRGPRGIGFLYARKQCTRRTQANDHVDHVQSIGKQLLTGGWEPSMIDIHAARWVTADAYRLLDSAERYEQYEVNFAAKVSGDWSLTVVAAGACSEI